MASPASAAVAWFAEDRRGGEGVNLVHEAAAEEGAQHLAAALDEQVGHPAAAELGEKFSDRRDRAASLWPPDLAAGRLEGRQPGCVGPKTSGDQHRPLAGRLDETAPEREPTAGIEHDPNSPSGALRAGGEEGVVGQGRADADKDRIHAAPQDVHELE